MPIESIAAFCAVSFALIVTPGADLAFAISAGLRRGLVLPAVAGLLTGHALYLGIVVVGVGALVAQHPAALTALTVAGCLYLVWLGAGMIRRPTTVRSAERTEGDSASRWWLRGLAVSALNPKVLLLFLALLAQFVDADAAWPAPAQMLLLGGMHIAACALVYSAAGIAAGAALAARPRAAMIVSRASGALMIVVASVILAERIALLAYP